MTNRYYKRSSRYIANNLLPISGRLIKFGSEPFHVDLRYGRTYSSGINYDNQGIPTQITNQSVATGIETFIMDASELLKFPIYSSLGTEQQSADTLWIQDEGGIPQPFILQQIHVSDVEGLAMLSMIPDRFVDNLLLNDNTLLRAHSPVDFNIRTTSSNINIDITNEDAGYPPITHYRMRVSSGGARVQTIDIPRTGSNQTYRHTPKSNVPIIASPGPNDDLANLLTTVGFQNHYIGSSAPRRRTPLEGGTFERFGMPEFGIYSDDFPKFGSILFDTRQYEDRDGRYGVILVANISQDYRVYTPWDAPTPAQVDDELVILQPGTNIELFRVGIGNAYNSHLRAEQGFFDHPNPGQSARRTQVGRFSDTHTEILFRPSQGQMPFVWEADTDYYIQVIRPSQTSIPVETPIEIDLTPVNAIGDTHTVIHRQ